MRSMLNKLSAMILPEVTASAVECDWRYGMTCKCSSSGYIIAYDCYGRCTKSLAIKC